MFTYSLYNTAGVNNNSYSSSRRWRHGCSSCKTSGSIDQTWEKERQEVQIHFLHLMWHHSSGSVRWENLSMRDDTVLGCSWLRAMDMTGCKNQIQPLRWHLEMSYHSLNEWKETDKQATFSSRLRWRFHWAEMTSNDWSWRELINGVLVYFYQKVPQLTTCLWHSGQSSATKRKYWHRESGGNEATTEDVNPLWDTLPPGFGLLKQ